MVSIRRGLKSGSRRLIARNVPYAHTRARLLARSLLRLLPGSARATRPGAVQAAGSSAPAAAAAARRPQGRPKRTAAPPGARSCPERRPPASLSPRSEWPSSSAAWPSWARAGSGATWAALPAATFALPTPRRSAAAGPAGRPADGPSAGRSPAAPPAGPRSQAPRAPPSAGAPAPGCAPAADAPAGAASGSRPGLPGSYFASCSAGATQKCCEIRCNTFHHMASGGRCRQRGKGGHVFITLRASPFNRAGLDGGARGRPRGAPASQTRRFAPRPRRPAGRPRRASRRRAGPHPRPPSASGAARSACGRPAPACGAPGKAPRAGQPPRRPAARARRGVSHGHTK